MRHSRVLDRLDDGDRFDFIFVAVRSNQMPSALEALRGNISETLVTLANSNGDYSAWKEIAGKGSNSNVEIILCHMSCSFHNV